MNSASNQHHRKAGRDARLAAGHANFVVARAAIDGPVVLRQERHLRLRTALGTDNRMHLTGRALRTSARSGFGAVTRTAARTTAGLIHQSFLLVELLLTCGEGEVIPAIAAFKGLVNETQTRDLLVI